MAFALVLTPAFTDSASAAKSKAECLKLQKDFDNQLKSQLRKSGKLTYDLAKKPKLATQDYLNVSKHYKSLVNKYVSIFEKGGACAGMNSPTNPYSWGNSKSNPAGWKATPNNPARW